MRIGFRTRWATCVIYLRPGWSMEIWLGRFGFYSGPSWWRFTQGKKRAGERMSRFTRRGWISFEK